MRKLLRISTIAAMVILLASCSDDTPGGGGGGDPAGPECTGSGQSTCATDFECVNGACVPVQAAITVCETCTASAECDTGLACAEVSAGVNACVPSCSVADPTCPIGFACMGSVTVEGDMACIPGTGVCCVDEDADGAGLGADCTAADCDDSNANCTTDCTDADSDTYCVTTDCDETSAQHWADCGSCVDADGDGYGTDCDLGDDCDDTDDTIFENCVACPDGDADGDGVCLSDDCDDTNANCWAAGCVDADSDTYCAEADCDETNAFCWDGACVDGDSDGYCVEADCSDSNVNCNADCTDGDLDGWCLGIDCDDTKVGCFDSAECTDADTDGYCGANDCDDTNTNCNVDTCTDADGDTWCLPHDCDDTDIMHWNDCGLCQDSDGDGYGVDCTAGTDCDDTNANCWQGVVCTDVDSDLVCPPLDCNDGDPDVYPGQTEECNGYDDNCVDGVDEGGAAWCLAQSGSNVNSTTCTGAGDCEITGCAPDYYHLDGNIGTGCECMAEPTITAGRACSSLDWIDLGDLSDAAGDVVHYEGTMPVATREMWFRANLLDDNANDPPDTSTPSGGDEFHFSVNFVDFTTGGTGNPGDQFRIQLVRNACGNTAEVAVGGGDVGTQITWYTNQATPNQTYDPDGLGPLPSQPTFGELNCDTPACDTGSPTTSNCRLSTSRCTDNSQEVFVRLTRTDQTPGTETCDRFRLRFSNGVDPAP